MPDLWQEMVLPSSGDSPIWELFHENSKTARHQPSLSADQVLEQMSRFHDSLPFEGYPAFRLPDVQKPLNVSLHEAIKNRTSAQDLTPHALALEEVGALLHFAYGVSRSNDRAGFPKGFRMTPSAGALYPLEIYFHSAYVSDIPNGLYHYHPVLNQLRLLRQGDDAVKISAALIQPDIAFKSSLTLFITACFERSIFKYGDRGYRYILLEAGHVAQNVNLISTALGFGSINIGGFHDRAIDELLGLDGVTQSTIYIVAIGKTH